jgi:hypothetical protein
MVKLTVNGTARTFDGDEDMPLLWYLSDALPTGVREPGLPPVLSAFCNAHPFGDKQTCARVPVVETETRVTKTSNFQLPIPKGTGALHLGVGNWCLDVEGEL